MEDAFARHLDNCKRSRVSSFTMPWERGPVGQTWIPRGAFPISAGHVDRDLDPRQVSSSFVSARSRLKLVNSGKNWDERLTSYRALSIKKWYSIVTEGNDAFDVVRQHYATRSGDSDKHLLIDSIQLALVSKATSTLHSRAGPVLRFVHHCKNT